MQSQRRKKKEKSESDDEDDSKSPMKQHGRSFTRAAVNDIRERPISYLASIAVYSYVALLFLDRISSDQETFWDSCYDLLFLCNSSLIIGATGMLFRSPLLIGISIGCVAFSHVSYMYDLITWAFLDQYTLGRTLFFENVALGDSWITTMHQFWYLPLCFAVLYCDFRSVGLPFRAWIYSWFINLGMSAFSYIHYSKVDKNGNNFAPSFNSAHEYLENDASLIHQADSSGFISFMLWRWMIESILLNGTFFAFLKAFSYILIERDGGKYKEKVK